MSLKRTFKTAPLPFQGQKRNFVEPFVGTLKELSQSQDIKVVVDLFGGSGLLSHTAKRELTGYEYNHEAIHIRQGRELLWLIFYLWYGVEWFVRLIQYWDRIQAYYNISFEREAYSNQHNLNYLNSRKWYSWAKYIIYTHNK